MGLTIYPVVLPNLLQAPLVYQLPFALVATWDGSWLDVKMAKCTDITLEFCPLISSDVPRWQPWRNSSLATNVVDKVLYNTELHLQYIPLEKNGTSHTLTTSWWLKRLEKIEQSITLSVSTSSKSQYQLNNIYQRLFPPIQSRGLQAMRSSSCGTHWKVLLKMPISMLHTNGQRPWRTASVWSCMKPTVSTVEMSANVITGLVEN